MAAPHRAFLAGNTPHPHSRPNNALRTIARNVGRAAAFAAIAVSLAGLKRVAWFGEFACRLDQKNGNKHGLVVVGGGMDVLPGAEGRLWF